MYFFNVIKSEHDSRDIILESVYGDSDIKLPKKLDLWKKLRAPIDQGTQGSCSAQVAAAMKEWQEKGDVNFKGRMSAQFIYNNRERHDIQGMTPRETFKILLNIGIVPDRDYRYGKIEKASEIDPMIFKMADKYKIKGYAQINTLDGLKKALYKNGPCYIAFPVYDEDSNEFWKPTKVGQKSKGGHAVTITGWTKYGFIIRNSWGDHWNGNGETIYPFKDWGMHWEIWTTIDKDNEEPSKKRDLRQISRFFKKIFK